MLALLALLVVGGSQSANSVNPFEVLQHAKLNVEAELAMAANYTCVETIERTYYAQKHACVASMPRSKPKEFMRDRLRLDVAVSQGREIFSWHGENRFTSNDIGDVITNGPKTSGQFIGFLRNIFFTPFVQFKYAGSSEEKGRTVYNFNYVVQVLRSTYYLKGRADASVIPYHGSFAVDGQSYELLHLSIIGDEIPVSSGICSAETDIEYQLVNISGRQSLLPSSFDLKVESDTDLYTFNHNLYTQCREFRGESTLHFTVVDPVANVAKKHVTDEPLPAGLTFKASLGTPIDDKSAFMGDAVEATLDEPITIPGTNTVIPKGAQLRGVISEMEQHSNGLEYWLFGIKFQHLSAGDDTYILNAWPLPMSYNQSGSRFGSTNVLTEEERDAQKRGAWFLDGSHFRLPKHFTRYWRTQDVPKQLTSTSSDATR